MALIFLILRPDSLKLNMALRSITLRTAVVLASVLIGTILVIQVFWLKKVYELEQRAFNTKVMHVIEGYYREVGDTVFKTSGHLSNLVHHPGPFIYTLRISHFPDSTQLLKVIREQLAIQQVYTLCGVYLYQARERKNKTELVIPSANSSYQTIEEHPVTVSNEDHLALYFPKRNKYVLLQLDFWVFSIIALLVIIILFSLGVYHIFRQRFLQEVQRDFIHQFTHEFKTPVSVLTLASDVLSKPEIARQPEKLSIYAGIVSQQTKNLGKQLERLVTLASSDSRSLSLKSEQVEMETLTQEAVASFRPLIEKKQATIGLDFPAPQQRLMGDAHYLFTVVANLIDNALKYSPKPVISITGRVLNNRYQLTVKDNGIGMNRKQRKKIFRKFYRINTGEAHAAEGLGIGLSFVKMIVDAHKGSIDVQSEPGKGSCFTITLPLAKNKEL